MKYMPGVRETSTPPRATPPSVHYPHNFFHCGRALRALLPPERLSLKVHSVQSPARVCAHPPGGGQVERAEPEFWGQGCLGAWDQISCLARGTIHHWLQDLEGEPPGELVPRRSELPWDKSASKPTAWPALSPLRLDLHPSSQAPHPASTLSFACCPCQMPDTP